MAEKKVFTLKTFDAKLYKWSPIPFEYKRLAKTKRPFFCNATPFSQGQDWISTYSFDVIVVDYKQERSAYVACDYVE